MDQNQLTFPKASTTAPVKVFCDVTVTNSRSAAGWVISDHNGRPVDIHHEALPQTNNNVGAERRAIKRAATVLEHSGVSHAIVYSDCEPAVKSIDPLDYSMDSMKIRSISRDNNIVAHNIASLNSRLQKV